MPALLSAPLVRSSIALDFAINQNEIAAMQCEQREVPGNCCAGRCMLGAAMQTVATAESPMAPEEKNEAVEVLTLAPAVLEREHARELQVEGASIRLIRWLEGLLERGLVAILGHDQTALLLCPTPCLDCVAEF